MKRKVLTLLFLAYVFLNVPQANANYVLPYPSYMPGNKLYRISRVVDQLKNWWYWGSIAQTKYHLELADKYLVEAKTLFEYNQFLLGVLALGDSDRQFQFIPISLARASGEDKDISRLKNFVGEAADKHVEILVKLENELPGEFVWTPEKAQPTTLMIRQNLDTSVRIRQRVR